MIIAIIAILSCVSVLGIAYVSFATADTAVRRYDEQLNTAATRSLEEIFIFIDPHRLRWFSLACFIGIAILAYILTESPIFTLICASTIAFLPTAGVTYLKSRRMKRFNRDLPDALQSTSNMLKSGLNLSGALEFIVEDGKGPVPQEFGLLLRELKLGVSYDTALDNMYGRMPLSDLQLVVAGMKISREIGGSLAEVLARLADTIRRRIEMEGKIDSLTSMGKLQGVVMTMLPIGVGYAIYKIEPEAMSKLFTHWTGWICCAVIITLELMGYMTIKKIVSIDV